MAICHFDSHGKRHQFNKLSFFLNFRDSQTWRFSTYPCTYVLFISARVSWECTSSKSNLSQLPSHDHQALHPRKTPTSRKVEIHFNTGREGSITLPSTVAYQNYSLLTVRRVRTGRRGFIQSIASTRRGRGLNLTRRDHGFTHQHILDRDTG